MRKEIKYEFFLGQKRSLENFLLLNSCKEIYKVRKVNSIYYDNYQFSLFNQNIDGIGLREKFRCRFYNEGQQGYIFENKCKLNEFNEKKYLDIELLKKRSKIRNKNNLIFKTTKNTAISIPYFILDNYFPRVFVTYNRKYFLSKCSKARITIDTEIKFAKVFVRKNLLYLLDQRFLNHNILEIKFKYDTQELSELISKITSEFNLTYSKCSKYTKAIELTY